MLSLTKIKEDLKEIRYYYIRKELFDKALKQVATNTIMDKVLRYSNAISTAPPRLYDMYISLYVNNYTQEGLSNELGYTTEYINRQNKQLVLYLQKNLVDSLC